MKTFPFDTFGLEEHDENVLYETYNELKKNYKVVPDGYFDVDLKEYDSFSEYSNVFVRETIEIPLKNTICYLLFTKVSYSGSGGSEYKFYAICDVKMELGHMLLRRMKFIDKLHELIKPVRVKFENDKNFSDNFYVLAKDSSKAKIVLGTKVRDAVINIGIDNFLVEMKNNHVIIGAKAPADTELALKFVKFLHKVVNIL
jgi:hypothetical protein